MTTLVTGATGLLGNNLVRMLVERGERVRAIVRSSGDPRPLEGLGVEVVCGDICDREAVQRACRGVKAVLHSAALVHIGWSGLKRQQQVNIEGTRVVAEAALRAGARLVYVSSVDALGLGSLSQPADEETPHEPPVPCPYVLTKRAAEAVVLELVDQGLDAVIVNPGFMLGPWDWKPSSGRMLLQIARGWAFVAPRGVNNFCDARDVAEGILAAVERGVSGRRYILGGKSLSYMEAWGVLASVTGVRRPMIPAGPIMMIVAGMYGDLRRRLLGREPDVNSASIAMSRLPKYYTNARAEKELGYRARDFRESAQDAWNWFREYGYAPA